jgi:hypothetical protein
VPIYIQEKVKPEALIRDLRRQARLRSAGDLFPRFRPDRGPEDAAGFLPARRELVEPG